MDTDGPFSLSAQLIFLLALAAAAFLPPGAKAQSSPTDNTLRVFLDCEGCNEQYIRRELTFVNYVRDRQQADVHVLGTRQRTGSGGEQYQIEFIGRQNFDEINYTLSYSAPSTATDTEVENGLTKKLRVGLAPFASETPAGEQLDISYADTQEEGEQPSAQQVNDPWNFWVFETELSGGIESERSRSEYELQTELSAERVTSTWKFENAFQLDYEEDTFERDSVDITSISRRTDFETSAVRSISDHWSVGAFGDAYSSTYSNTALGLRLSPAIEYNVFPYDISNRKELTFAYRVGPRRLDYRQETIFGKTEQYLVEQSLEVTFDMQQTWGNIFASLEGSHYFHDIRKNRVQFFSFVDLRLVEGLSLRLNFDAELIHDQLYLPKGDASLEEILLRRRALLTTFQYGGSIGLSYTFGSIYNNVVNPRLGGGGGGGRGR